MSLSWLRRRSWWLLGATFIIAAVACALTDRVSLEQAGTRQLSRLGLVEIGRLGQLRDGKNVAMGTAIPARIEQRGGPRWAAPILEDVATDDPTVTPTSAAIHVLSIDLLTDHRQLVLVLRLWRQGWELRNPWPLRTGVVPELALAGGFLGALISLATGRMDWGCIVAGGASQLGASWLASVGPVLVSGPWWADNPAARVVVDLVRGAPDWSGMAAAALAVTLTILAWWDARKARYDRRLSPGTLIRVVVAAIGVGAWIEAASRTGWWPWLSVGWGWLGFAALGGAWGVAAMGGRHAP